MMLIRIDSAMTSQGFLTAARTRVSARKLGSLQPLRGSPGTTGPIGVTSTRFDGRKAVRRKAGREATARPQFGVPGPASQPGYPNWGADPRHRSLAAPAQDLGRAGAWPAGC